MKEVHIWEQGCVVKMLHKSVVLGVVVIQQCHNVASLQPLDTDTELPIANDPEELGFMRKF